MSNNPERIRNELIIEAPVTKKVLNKGFVGHLALADVTPSVKNLETWKALNVGAVLVTDFDDGQEDQALYILGDGQTSVKHGTNIFTTTGADKLLAANRLYFFRRISAKWYEVGP